MSNCKICGNQMPLLDDWVDNHPDAWDYMQVLRDNEASVTCTTQVIDGEGQITNLPPALCGWSFSWCHGSMFIGQTSVTIARKAAALFISLWLRGVSASFADKLMDGYIIYLERQEGKSLSFLATTFKDFCGFQNFRLTREGFCNNTAMGTIEHRIIKALDLHSDEEIIVTFTKRKKT